MLAIISPAKTLDESRLKRSVAATQPQFVEQAAELVDILRKQSQEELGTLMGISPKLAALNAARYRDFSLPLCDDNAKPALFAFQGDVYRPIDALAYDDDTLAFAQSHLCILSGLYGVLRPLDYLYPYRLEMGTRLKNPHGDSLYAYWGAKVTEALNSALEASGSDTVLNLASEEYSKVVQQDRLKGRWLTLSFKEGKDGAYRTIGIHAKRARGLMVDYFLRQRCKSPDALQHFDAEGYRYRPDLSDDAQWVFARG